MNKKRTSIILLVIGLITLIAGVVFLILKLTAKPSVHDGKYLVSISEWVEQGEPNVIWKFTEIGKGTLTTNNHINDYDFTWTIEDGRLKIDTEWLYTLSNEFDYTLDQNENILTLTSGNEDTVFVPLVTE
jgi:hypothetical protein